MARSRLYSALRRTAMLALDAHRRGVPAREHAEARRAAFDATRREFIRRTAATAGVLSVGARLPFLAACGAEEVRSPGTATIAVVGGGIAGLMCARTLEAAGRRVTLFDAQKRIGGRISSARGRFPAEQIAELGGELIDTEHMIMRNLATELGLTLDDFLEYDRGVAPQVFYFGGRLVSEMDFLDAWAALLPRIMADLSASASSQAAFERLDAMSVAAWLDGVPGLDPTLRRIIEVAYIGEYGLEPSEQSAFNFLWLVDAEEPDAFLIFGSSDERFRVHQGNDSIPTQVAEALKSEVQLERRLVRMRKLSDGRHQLTFDRAGSATEVVFDKVVLTLPWSLLREVDFGDAISAEKARMVRELGYGTNAKLMLGFEGRPWRTVHRSAGSTFCDNGPQTLWETSRGQAGTQGILTVFTGGAEGLAVGEGTAEARAQGYLPALDAIYPGTRAAYRADSALRSHWPTFEFAKGSYSCLKPGQAAWMQRIGERDGNVVFAGEHLSVDFQGYMEGAAESGIRAAEALLADEV